MKIMTTIHVQCVGEQAVLPQREFEQLVELAKRSGEVTIQIEEGDTSTSDMMRLAQRGGSFEFWKDAEENVYSLSDGEPV